MSECISIALLVIVAALLAAMTVVTTLRDRRAQEAAEADDAARQRTGRTVAEIRFICAGVTPPAGPPDPRWRSPPGPRRGPSGRPGRRRRSPRDGMPRRGHKDRIETARVGAFSRDDE